MVCFNYILKFTFIPLHLVFCLTVFNFVRNKLIIFSIYYYSRVDKVIKKKNHIHLVVVRLQQLLISGLLINNCIAIKDPKETLLSNIENYQNFSLSIQSSALLHPQVLLGHYQIRHHFFQPLKFTCIQKNYFP